MKGSFYKLTTPTLGILSTDVGENRIPVTIPMNAIVMAAETVDGNKLVEVVWEGKGILMFTQDLRTRGELIKAST